MFTDRRGGVLVGEWGGNPPPPRGKGCRERVTLSALCSPLTAGVARLPDGSSGLGTDKGDAGRQHGTAPALPCRPACPWGPRGHGGFGRSAHSPLSMVLAGLPCPQPAVSGPLLWAVVPAVTPVLALSTTAPAPKPPSDPSSGPQDAQACRPHTEQAGAGTLPRPTRQTLTSRTWARPGAWE